MPPLRQRKRPRCRFPPSLQKPSSPAASTFPPQRTDRLRGAFQRGFYRAATLMGGWQLTVRAGWLRDAASAVPGAELTSAKTADDVCWRGTYSVVRVRRVKSISCPRLCTRNKHPSITLPNVGWKYRRGNSNHSQGETEEFRTNREPLSSSNVSQEKWRPLGKVIGWALRGIRWLLLIPLGSSVSWALSWKPH